MVRSMRVAIHTLGTRGDVQPYLALALGLKQAGHEVLIAAPSQFESFVVSRGIAFAHLPSEYLALLETPEAKAAMAGGAWFMAGFRMLKQFRPIGRQQLSAEWQAARRFRPELIIYHPKAIAAAHIAEKLSCPAVLASPLPGFTPTAAFASPLVPFRSLGPLNRLTHSAMAHSAYALFRGMIGEWRATELHLANTPEKKLRPRATLYAYSPHVVPVPPDWPNTVAVTGYWFLGGDDVWQPDPQLQRFVEGDERPVYVGFGSMPGVDPTSLTKLVLEALAKAGKRGVLAVGGGALRGDLGASHVHFIQGAPHAQLFPLMSACVHHGGAGTTGAALRAGKPNIICPFFGDQPFWGRRIDDLGVGPRSRGVRNLSADWLAAAIAEATGNPLIQQRANRLGEAIRVEDGVASAIGFLRSQHLLN
ncbi:glycosyltransferase [Bradyrhizobium yuanmingense]|uniref:glycosyltransferase n=1 Tax=Bradyrhizobium yuanmingense TaxID=108015 RepID=UPI003F7DF36B